MTHLSIPFFALICTLIFLLIIQKVLSINNESNVCENHDFIKEIERKFVPNTLNLRYGGNCRKQSHCICLENGYKINVHCEATQDVKVIFRTSFGDIDADVTIDCNDTLPSSLFEINFYEDLHLNLPNLLSVHMIDCPEPLTNYSTLSEPKSVGHSEIEFPKFPIIETFHVDCIYRKNFTVHRRHFLGLQGLYMFQIRCSTLSDLPSDLFDGMRNVKYIIISETLIQSIPGDLFSGLKNLQEITLVNNQIEYIHKETFLGLENLEDLHLSNNRLTHLDDEIFNGVPNLTQLTLKNNKLSKLPKSISKLRKLDTLNVKNNTLKDIHVDHCPNVTVHGNNSEQNGGCFPTLITARKIDLSENQINKLPSIVTSLNHLMDLKISHSSGLLNQLSKFLTSNSLILLDMKNSSIFSLDFDFLSGFPSLQLIDFSMNRINNLSEYFFLHNDKLKNIDLSRNKINSLPNKLFVNNPDLQYIDLSSNQITEFSPTLFLANKMVKYLYFSNNKLEQIPLDDLGMPLLLEIDFSFNNLNEFPGTLLRNSTLLKHVDFSSNNMQHIQKESFWNLTDLAYLNLSNNGISFVDGELFKHRKSLNVLDLSDNMLKDFPFNEFMRYLPLNENATNDLQYVVYYNDVTDPINKLFLDGNMLTNISIQFLKNTEILSLSRNNLTHVVLPFSSRLRKLYLSHNSIKLLSLPWALQKFSLEVDLSHNSIAFCETSIIVTPLYESVFDLPMDRSPYYSMNFSSNNISFDFAGSEYKSRSKLWGKSTAIIDFLNLQGLRFVLREYGCLKFLKRRSWSPCDRIINLLDIQNYFDRALSSLETGKKGRFSLIRNNEQIEQNTCDKYTILDFSNNSIEHVLLDWRAIRSLKLVDVRRNKIKFLKEQDILFQNVQVYKTTCVVENDSQLFLCKRKLTVDLRENEIQGVELSSWNLVNVPSSCNRTLNHSHATILLDDNPFYCGLGVFNFLRYVEEDVTLMSETQRRSKTNKALPAKIFPGNLTCNAPEMVKGKRVMETETYVHQLMPMLGLCAFRGCDIQQISTEVVPSG